MFFDLVLSANFMNQNHSILSLVLASLFMYIPLSVGAYWSVLGGLGQLA